MKRGRKIIDSRRLLYLPDTDDKTTDFTFFGPRLLFTLTAQLTSGSQETKYIYGVSSSDGSKIASNDLLRETRWPDKSTGAASSSEAEYSSYNALGQRIKFTDRNDNVHEFSFDVVGRPTKDAVTTLGSGVDGTVRRHETNYDSAGRAYQFTSYDAASGGNIVNQVEQAFNGLGQIITEYQSHSGAVNTGSSPKVQYTYSEMASGANHSRLTSLIYPDTFTVGYNYASGLDNTISRLTSMTASSTTLEGFAYLGLGTVVERTHPESGVNLSYIGGGTGEAGDKYVGLDRFGRIIDQWWKTANGRTFDRFKYGYDRNSNRLFRSNESNHAFDELYHADGASNGYDGLNQLGEFQRGVLSDTNSDMIPDTVASASKYQTWDPDAVGNFEGVNTDGTNQSRTHNKQNQSTVVGGNNLTFDDNGNMTTDETGRSIGFDAWNRLVKINGNTRYANDALGRRIKEGSIDLYHSTNWQVLEEYNGGDPVNRYVWSPVYVDAMVLRDRDLDPRVSTLEERVYVLHDANFNVTSIISTGANVLERFAYDPYGRFDFKDASYGVRSSSSYAWVYLHQGGRFDATAALFHFRNRDYSPALMRWASVDPIGFRAKDVNFYRYEKDNPTVHLDANGLDVSIGIRCAGAAVGAGGASGAGAGLGAGGLGAGAIGGIILAPVYAIGCIGVAQNVGGSADALGAWFAGVDTAWVAAPIATATVVGPIPIMRWPPPPIKPGRTSCGDCSPEFRALLQRAVDAACDVERRCQFSQDVNALWQNWAQNMACAHARDTINIACYGGGNRGHQQAANNARGAAERCLGFLRRKGEVPNYLPK